MSELRTIPTMDLIYMFHETQDLDFATVVMSELMFRGYVTANPTFDKGVN